MEVLCTIIAVFILAVLFILAAIIKWVWYFVKHPLWPGLGYAVYLLAFYIGQHQWFKAGMAIQAIMLTTIFLLPREWEWGKHADWAKIAVFATFCLLFFVSFITNSWQSAMLFFLPAAIATALIPIDKPVDKRKMK